MNPAKLHQISQSRFEIMDYSRDQFTVTVAVDGYDDSDTFELTHEDVLFGALQLQWIDSYIYPLTDGGPYLIEINEKAHRFNRWWEGVHGTDLDKVFARALTEKASHLIEKAAQQLAAA